MRGRPASDRRPVATLAINYDLPDGIYLGGSAAAVLTRSSGLEPQAIIEYAGITRSLTRDIAFDIGIAHNAYTEYAGLADHGSYTEGYVGLVGHDLSARVFLSPGYFRRDAPTLYTDISGSIDVTRHWAILAHGGLLTRLRTSSAGRGSSLDWRIGARRRLGVADLSVAWTGYAEGIALYGHPQTHGNSLVLTASLGL